MGVPIKLRHFAYSSLNLQGEEGGGGEGRGVELWHLAQSTLDPYHALVLLCTSCLIEEEYACKSRDLCVAKLEFLGKHAWHRKLL